MRNRARPDEQREPSRDREVSHSRGARELSGREQTRDTGRVRVPKIQYRFLKELEQKGVSGEIRMSALSMADKIRRYPLEDRAVMGSWERFTKTAIEEFKNGTGRADERDRQHFAYAVLFSAMRDAPPAQSVGELKQRIEVVSARRPPSTRGADREPAATNREQPRQQELLEQARSPVERQVERSMEVLRTLTPELRATIETNARGAIVNGDHTRASARDAVPDAFRALREDPSEQKTARALTLALVAATPEQRTLVAESGSLERDVRKQLEADAKARENAYASRESALVDVRHDATQAALRYALSPSPESRREALLLALTREEMECRANPRRLPWQNVADELGRGLA